MHNLALLNQALQPSSIQNFLFWVSQLRYEKRTMSYEGLIILFLIHNA